MNEYEKEIKNFYSQLHEVSSDMQISILKVLYKFILNSFEQGLISNKRLAYDIAGTLQFEATIEDIYSDIASLAGELELPDAHISGDVDEKFSHLLELLRALK